MCNATLDAGALVVVAVGNANTTRASVGRDDAYLSTVHIALRVTLGDRGRQHEMLTATLVATLALMDMGRMLSSEMTTRAPIPKP